MSSRLKIPRLISCNLHSALKARGCGKQKRIQNSAAENRITRVLQPDQNLKKKFGRVFDLKGGDAMIR